MPLYFTQQSRTQYIRQQPEHLQHELANSSSRWTPSETRWRTTKPMGTGTKKVTQRATTTEAVIRAEHHQAEHPAPRHIHMAQAPVGAQNLRPMLTSRPGGEEEWKDRIEPPIRKTKGGDAERTEWGAGMGSRKLVK
ncbi:hypothetical protein Daesc_003877 [Daldinia eschscholtzii]|uniref:Uncharacterized protein n=1 Tax=Daldinia eschscholtzii TaxID=292717 RepID=A0AAX6MMP4_9PEZI